MWETWAWSLGWEDYLEKGIATHSSILAWRIPWTEKPDKLQSMGRKESNMTKQLSLSLSWNLGGYYRCESWTINKAEQEELMLLNCGVGEDSWESIGLQEDQICQY